MSSNPGTVKPSEVVERLLEIFGTDKLALILHCYELIQAEAGYGEIEVMIYNGEIKNVKATISLKVLQSEEN